MKSKVLIFCVLILCTTVVSFPYAEDLMRHGAYKPDLSFNAQRQYDTVNIGRPQNVNYGNQQLSEQELPHQLQNNGYYDSFQKFRTPSQVIPNNQVPINNFQNKPLENQFIRPAPGIISTNERLADNYNIHGAYHNYQQGWEEPQQPHYQPENNFEHVRHYQQNPLIVEHQPVHNPIEMSSVITHFENRVPAPEPTPVEWLSPVPLKPVSTSVIAPNAHHQPQPQHYNNIPFTQTPIARTPEVINPVQNVENIYPRQYAQKHEVDRIWSIPEVQKAVASRETAQRYLLVYPNGTIDRVDHLDNIAEKHPNLLFINSGHPSLQNPVTNSPEPVSTLPLGVNPNNDFVKLPYSDPNKNALNKVISTTEITPIIPPVTATTPAIPSSSKLPENVQITTLSPIDLIKKLKDLVTTTTPLPIVTEVYTTPTTKNPLNINTITPAVPLASQTIFDNYKTTTPVPATSETTISPVSKANKVLTTPNPNPKAVPDKIIVTSTTAKHVNQKVTTTPIPITLSTEPVTEDDDEVDWEDNYDDNASTMSPIKIKDITIVTPPTTRKIQKYTVSPAGKPSTRDAESLDTDTSSTEPETIDEIDLANLKSTTKPVVWFRATDVDMLEKFSASNNTYDIVYIFQVHPQPIIEKDTKTYVYPNGTIVKEFTETKWQDKDDLEPEFNKTVTIFNATDTFDE